MAFVQIDSMMVLRLFAGWKCFPEEMTHWRMNSKANSTRSWKVNLMMMRTARMNLKMNWTTNLKMSSTNSMMKNYWRIVSAV
ncbi:MAG: hypothetical protein ACI9XC_000722 [Gammaproteobacteria bacterium]|jgi:hypothetical protein